MADPPSPAKPVGHVDYQLRSDLLELGPFTIERIEVVAVCDTRQEAVEWMRTNRSKINEGDTQ